MVADGGIGWVGGEGVDSVYEKDHVTVSIGKDSKGRDVRTFQAEDEIAAMGSVIGAAFGGALAVTGTSGPGVALKSEGMNLAVALELPMVIVNVQRGGPSTGLPTKVEQSDLLQAFSAATEKAPWPSWRPIARRIVSISQSRPAGLPSGR